MGLSVFTTTVKLANDAAHVLKKTTLAPLFVSYQTIEFKISMSSVFMFAALNLKGK